MLSMDTLTSVILNLCEDVTNKKLQKLSYYVYAWYLTIYGRKISNLNFEAWEHGPVCRKLYNRYRHYGWKVIPAYNGFVLADDTTIRFIQAVINVYGQYSADQLENMTHQERPWQEARTIIEQHDFWNVIISDDIIKTFYSEQIETKQRIMDYICA